MNSSLPTARRSPRRELQGPRPTPLKVNKDSHKIKKPPIAPQYPSHEAPPAAQPPQYRPPVIIYAVSPKVIHTKASDFMALVQRLTGLASNVSTSDPLLPSPSAAGGLSPAARLATMEKSVHASNGERSRKIDEIIDQIDIDVDIDVDASATMLNRPSSFPGILSPVPSALPPISSGFFSPSVDPNFLSFLHELSPAFHGNRSYMESTFLASPHNFMATPTIPSPGAWDLFRQFQDL